MNPTSSNQALTNLQQFQSGMQSPDQSLTAAQNNLGVNQAQQQVTGLRGAISNTTNLINQVAPSVYGRTQNSLVTNAQAGQQISNAQAPLNDQLNKENTDYGNANQDYQNLEQQAEARSSAQQAGQQGQLSALQNIYQDLYGQEQNASQLAEQQREFNLTPHGPSSSDDGLGAEIGALLGSGSSSTPDSNTNSVITSALKQMYSAKSQPFATEKVVAPAVAKQLGISTSDALNLIYPIRKQLYGE